MHDLDKELATDGATPKTRCVRECLRGYGTRRWRGTGGASRWALCHAVRLNRRPDRCFRMSFFFGGRWRRRLSRADLGRDDGALAPASTSGLPDAMIHQGGRAISSEGVVAGLPCLLRCMMGSSLRKRCGAAWRWKVMVVARHFSSIRRCSSSRARGLRVTLWRGFIVLLLAKPNHTLSPGLGPAIVIGQSLMATIPYFASGENDCGRVQ